MNARDWVGAVGGAKFDYVFSVAVWEHVLDPYVFASECLSLVGDGGTLVMICPDYGSLARRLFGRRWPYFEPGEHLSIPTQIGATACIKRAAYERGYGRAEIRVSTSSLWVGYSIKYLLNVLGLDVAARFVPSALSAPLPTGILCTIAQLPPRATKGMA
jgi:hypothetical protein